MKNQTQSLKQSDITNAVIPFLKKRLEREIDLLTERISETLKKENAFLRTELARLKAENITLKRECSLFSAIQNKPNGDS